MVRARGGIQSPVLVGRDSFLTLIEDRLAGAAAGEGGLLFGAGEAGIAYRSDELYPGCPCTPADLPCGFRGTAGVGACIVAALARPAHTRISCSVPSISRPDVVCLWAL